MKELRPVEYWYYKDGKKITGKGYFHGWYTTISDYYRDTILNDTVAIIETNSGEVITIPINGIRFTDR